MKHLIAILAAIVAALVAIGLLFTSVKSAGINLSWDDCGSHGAQLRAFACDTNAGSNTLVGSFVAPAGVEQMDGNEFVLYLESADVLLPGWWSLRSVLCRAGSLNANFDFTAGPFNCSDYWQNGAIGKIVMDAPAGNHARIRGAVALPSGDPRITPVPEGTHVYSFKATIDNAKTTGNGACGGCASLVCIVLQSIKLDQPLPLPSILVANVDGRNWVSWQCPSFPVLDAPGLCSFTSCPTPARSQTWGQIKQLYH
jgi:hypothetical protein